MIEQYPHYLFVLSSPESTQDGDGNWVEESGEWVLHSICREQTNGRGTVVNVADGKAVVFASVIHLPDEAEMIKEGTEIMVSTTATGNGERIKGRVLKFDKGQLHSRLWV